MSDVFYPEIDSTWLLPLKVAFESLHNDPLWLDRDNCPYDDDTTERIRAIWAIAHVQTTERPERPPGIATSEDKWGDLATEMTKLFDDLRYFQTDIPIDDVKERMTYFRTATALLEKITSLTERAHNVRAVSTFHSKVISVFDQILEPAQRTAALELLKE